MFTVVAGALLFGTTRKLIAAVPRFTGAPVAAPKEKPAEYGRPALLVASNIEKTYRRPLFDRALRALLVRVLPDPSLFRLAAVAGMVAKPLGPLFWLIGLKRIAAMLRLTPAQRLAPPTDGGRKVFPATVWSRSTG